MNTQNYASLEASKRLHDAGIVLETDVVWARDENGVLESCPAPSMAEVWRELPDDIDGHELGMGKEDGESYVFYKSLKDFPYNTNPTDALIDLLIWVRSERGRR